MVYPSTQATIREQSKQFANKASHHRSQEAPVADWEDAEDGFSISDVSTVVKDLWLNAFVELVVELDGVMQNMVAWCERCPCHDHIQQQYKEYIPLEVARSECGDMAAGGLPCPLRGCRAPEVAAGSSMALLRRSWTEATLSVKRFRPPGTTNFWDLCRGPGWCNGALFDVDVRPRPKLC